MEMLRPYPPSILLRLRELDEIMDRHLSLCAHRNGDEAKQKRLGRLFLRSGKFSGSLLSASQRNIPARLRDASSCPADITISASAFSTRSSGVPSIQP